MAIQIECKNSFSGAPTWAAGNFDDGEMLGTGYSIDIRENGGTASSWAWSIVTAPRGSTASINTPTAQTASFDPDMVGTWRIKCEIDGGTEEEEIYLAVAPLNNYGRMAARGEESLDPTWGWAEGQNDLLRSIDAGEQKAFAGHALVHGDIVAYATFSGTVNQPRVYKLSSFGSYIPFRKPLGMVIDTSVSTDGKTRLITKGMCLYDTGGLSGSAIGKTVFADPSTGTLTMTTTQYPVGIVVRQGGSIPSSTLGAIYFDFSGLGLSLEERFIPIEWMENGPTPAAPAVVLSNSNGSVRVRKFDSYTEEDLIFQWDVPLTCVTPEGLMISVIGYISESTATSTLGVSFEFERYGIGDNDPLGGGTFAYAANSEKTFASHAQYDRFKTDEVIMDISSGPIVPGESLMIKMARDVADAQDTYGDDIAVYGIVVRWVARK